MCLWQIKLCQTPYMYLYPSCPWITPWILRWRTGCRRSLWRAGRCGRWWRVRRPKSWRLTRGCGQRSHRLKVNINPQMRLLPAAFGHWLLKETHQWHFPREMKMFPWGRVFENPWSRPPLVPSGQESWGPEASSSVPVDIRELTCFLQGLISTTVLNLKIIPGTKLNGLIQLLCGAAYLPFFPVLHSVRKNSLMRWRPSRWRCISPLAVYWSPPSSPFHQCTYSNFSLVQSGLLSASLFPFLFNPLKCFVHCALFHLHCFIFIASSSLFQLLNDFGLLKAFWFCIYYSSVCLA